MTCSGRGSFPVDDGASSGSKAGINGNLTSKFLVLLAYGRLELGRDSGLTARRRR